MGRPAKIKEALSKTPPKNMVNDEEYVETGNEVAEVPLIDCPLNTDHEDEDVVNDINEDVVNDINEDVVNGINEDAEKHLDESPIIDEQIVGTEFLNVTVSRSCDRANFPDLAQNPEICMRKPKIYAFTPLLQFFFMIHTYYVIFGVIFALLRAQNFRTKTFDRSKKSFFRTS